MKGSIVIIMFFVLGSFVGYFGDFGGIDFGAWAKWVLYALLFFVGISIGSDSTIVDTVKRYRFRIVAPAIGTIVGTLVGVSISALFIDRSLTDLLAVGSGFGYYSLSTVLITESKGAELGTLALLSNIFREITTLLLAPLLFRFFGPLAPIASGGATTMDATLPIITATSGKEYVMVAIAHGFMVDLSVPFLVSFFCEI